MHRVLKMARMKENPEKFVRRSLILSLYVTIGFNFFLFIILAKQEANTVIVLATVPITLLLSFFFIVNMPHGTMRRRAHDIDREVVFAGRYLLVKIESGQPLLNSLIDASKSYGVCGKYFKEIADDVSTGTPIEKALENAREYNSSEKFKRILWQIVGALKTGAEIGESLKSTLDAITNEQVIEIQRYSKKLNSFMLFYMVAAVVMPSLGVTMLAILSSFLHFEITSLHMLFVIVLLLIIQAFFIILIRSSKPSVNI